MAIRVTHATVTGASADPTALVDGPAWDAAHVVTGLVASDVSFTPSGLVSSTNVQDAIAELDAEKAAISSLSSVAVSGVGADIITNLVAWTPVLTFATPGDLAVAYTTQFGRYAQLSNHLVWVQFALVTSTFSFTTASGIVQISGLPFTSQNVPGQNMRGALSFGGINKAGYTQVSLGLPVNTSSFGLNASGMGVAASAVSAADMPSGGTVNLTGEIVIAV